jgi:5-bromo-4-chloroindolyl phosphate hydrolysis protein
MNKAIDSGSEALKDALNSFMNTTDAGNSRVNTGSEAYKKYRYQAPESFRKEREKPEPKKETSLALYNRNTGMQVKGTLQAVTGGILASGMGLGVTVSAIWGVLGNSSPYWLGITGFMAVATAAGIGLLVGGCRKLGRLSRFRRYVKTLGEHTYCNFDQLSQAVGKPLKFVKRDIKGMIQKGWFLEGHVDQQETCLITSNATYHQYVATQKQLEQKQRQQAQQEEARGKMPKEVQEVLDKGNAYLDKIHRSNDAIPGEEISSKISRMELIIQKIFERAKEHPEVIPDLKRLMDYYLPMTVKLLDAYEDMDRQPIQGENIRSSKKEIEDTLDTLNTAFEKLLDSIFKDTAWDVSSDITVLHSVLAQEGLTEDAFEQMRRESTNH